MAGLIRLCLLGERGGGRGVEGGEGGRRGRGEGEGRGKEKKGGGREGREGRGKGRGVGEGGGAFGYSCLEVRSLCVVVWPLHTNKRSKIAAALAVPGLP